jgi:hypothetical protein
MDGASLADSDRTSYGLWPRRAAEVWRAHDGSGFLYYCMMASPMGFRARIRSLILMILVAGLATAEEITFSDIQIPSVKGELTNASLTFSDNSQQVIVRISDGRLFTVPYVQIDNISYEYTKKHRFKQGAAIAMLSPGTGIILAFTKSKNHWLEIDFHDKSAPSALVLKLDKRDYRKVCDTAKVHTGKQVATLGKTDTKLIKMKSRGMESATPPK